MKKKYRYNIEYSKQGVVEMTDEEYCDFLDKTNWLPDQEAHLIELGVERSIFSNDVIDIDVREITNEKQNN